MRKRLTAFSVAALLVLVVTLVGGCSGGNGGSSGARGGMVRIGDLSVTAGGELRWEAVKSAHDYSVLARGGEDVVSWTGAATHVNLDEEAATTAPPATTGKATTPGALVKGATYRWFVTAYDADGTVLGSSNFASFRCTSSCAPAA